MLLNDDECFWKCAKIVYVQQTLYMLGFTSPAFYYA